METNRPSSSLPALNQPKPASSKPPLFPPPPGTLLLEPHRKRPDPACPVEGARNRRRGRTCTGGLPPPRGQCPGEPMVPAGRRRPWLTGQGLAKADHGTRNVPAAPGGSSGKRCGPFGFRAPNGARRQRPRAQHRAYRGRAWAAGRVLGCRAGSTGSAPAFARPGCLQTAPPKASVHLR